MRAIGAAIAAAVMTAGTLAAVTPASAAPQRYDSCAELHEAYPYGVGERDAKDRTSGTPVTSFKRSNRLYRAVLSGEGPTVVSIVTVLVLIYCLSNLLVDLLYAWLDPRIRYDS